MLADIWPWIDMVLLVEAMRESDSPLSGISLLLNEIIR
jgi:hypothetical protein